MKGKMVSVILTGILTFGVISLLNSGYIGSQLTPSAEIWVDKGYGSSYSDGEGILILFKVISPAPTAKVSIIDYTTSGTIQYLVQNEYVYTNATYCIEGIVTCPQGPETIDILATTVVNGQMFNLKDSCTFYVTGCSGYGYIRIHANVTEYEVWLDGAHILTEGIWSAGGGGFTAPYPDGICEFSVTPGKHIVQLKKIGCEPYPYTLDVFVNSGEKKEFYVILSCVVDDDKDGYPLPGDCDDNDGNIHPGATEVCDGKDNNCDGVIDEGFDNDRDGYTTCGGDIDDSDPNVNPGAQEICDEKDNDGDGEIDEGVDRDGDGYTTCKGDLDDSDRTVYPGATEVCDGKDNDCDGEIDEDFDKDRDGYTTCKGDLDDSDRTVYPGATEVCDRKDNDCDGVIDEGFDKDNDGFTTCGGDPDDKDSSVYPGAQEICDGKDNDNDGKEDEDSDKDKDGFTTCGGDCDDNNSDINPKSEEVCDNEDNDCDGEIDEDFDKDEDGFTTCEGDCDDENPNKYPGAQESCGEDYNCDNHVEPCTENLKVSVTDSKGNGLRANIYVDRRYYGETDSAGILTIYNLEVDKSYAIQSKVQRYKIAEKTVKVEKNITNPVRILMEKERTIFLLLGLFFLCLMVPVLLLYRHLRIKNNSQMQTCRVCTNKVHKSVTICPYCRTNLGDTRTYDDDTRIYGYDGR